MSLKTRGLLFLMGFCAVAALGSPAYCEGEDAGSADDRAAIVSQQLDCVGQRLQNQKSVQWEDVCYTSPRNDDMPSNMDDRYADRDQVIAQSLDDVARSHQEYYQDQNLDHIYKPQYTKQVEEDMDKPRDVPTSDEPTENSALPTKQHQFEVSNDTFYNVYREPNVMKNHGVMSGVAGSYTYRPKEDDPLYFKDLNVWKLDGRYSYGKLDYKSTDTGSLSDVKDYAWEIRGVAGKDFYLPADVRTTPYFGLGYRYLNDNTAGRVTTTGFKGYEREANYYYFPIGVDIMTPLPDTWNVTFTGEYDFLLHGLQKSHLSDVPGGYEDINNAQKHGFGIRTSMKFLKQNQYVNFLVEPFVRYWHIEDSEVETDSAGRNWIEPNNKTMETGLRLGLQY